MKNRERLKKRSLIKYNEIFALNYITTDQAQCECLNEDDEHPFTHCLTSGRDGVDLMIDFLVIVQFK